MYIYIYKYIHVTAEKSINTGKEQTAGQDQFHWTNGDYIVS